MGKTKNSILLLLTLVMFLLPTAPQTKAANNPIGSIVSIEQTLAFDVNADITVGDFDGTSGTYTGTTMNYGNMNPINKATTTKIKGVKLHVETNATSYTITTEIDKLMTHTNTINTIPNSTTSPGFAWSTAHDGTRWSIFGRVGETGIADTVATGTSTSGTDHYVDYKLMIDHSIIAGTYSNTVIFTLSATY
jgi:hypothetical protein